jgi:hypothetical protein
VVAAPLGTALLATILPLSYGRIRQLSLLSCGLSLVGIVILLSQVYLAGDFVMQRFDLVAHSVGGKGKLGGMVWVFPALVLGLAFQLVHFAQLVLDGPRSRGSRYVLVAQSVFVGAALGVLASPGLLTAAGFLGLMVFTRYIYHSVGLRPPSLASVSDTAAIGLAGVLLLGLVGLLQGEAYRELVGQWFRLDFGSYEITAGSLGFLLLTLGVALVSGLFPFHGSLRRIFEVVTLEKAVFGPLQTVTALWILFSIAPQIYLSEMNRFSAWLSVVSVIGVFFSSLFLLAAQQIRGKLFWLHQFIGCFSLLGIFLLTPKSWHGVLILLGSMALAMALVVFALGCRSRRPEGTWGLRPKLGTLLVLAILSAFLFPLSAGFYGGVLVFWDALRAGGVVAVAAAVSLPLFFWGARGLFSMEDFGERDTELATSGDLSASEWLALSPLVVLLMFSGLVPKLILSPLGRVIESYRSMVGL